jgi:hypothetical protein
MNRHVAVLAIAVVSAIPAIASAQAKQAGNSMKMSPAAEALVAQEKKLAAAVMNHDYATFNNILGADFVYTDGEMTAVWERSKSEQMLKMCTTKRWAIDNPMVTPSGSDVLVLTYKANTDQTCDGKKVPSPLNVMSVWRKSGARWVAVAHSETPVMK